MTNCERLSLMTSSDKVGRCEISMVFLYLLLGTRYLMPTQLSGRRLRGSSFLLRVVLDDQLLGEWHLDLGALRKLVDQDALLLTDHLQPARDRAVTRGLASDLERHGVQRLALDVDDVVLRHPIAGDGHLDAVDREVAMADQLTGHPARPGDPGAVHHVVQPALQDLQQLVTGLAGTAGRFGVVAAELLFHDAGGEAGLLLLLQLLAGFAFLDPRAGVLARRVGTLLEGLVSTHEVDAEAARLAGDGSGVTSHFFLPRPFCASAGGSRCAAGG